MYDLLYLIEVPSYASLDIDRNQTIKNEYKKRTRLCICLNFPGIQTEMKITRKKILFPKNWTPYLVRGRSQFLHSLFSLPMYDVSHGTPLFSLLTMRLMWQRMLGSAFARHAYLGSWLLFFPLSRLWNLMSFSPLLFFSLGKESLTLYAKPCLEI